MAFEMPEKVRRELGAAGKLDADLGAELRDEAMARVWDAADPSVKADARRAVRDVAARSLTFTSDDVWREMRLRPDEPRMLGPVMRWAQTQKLCERTDRTVLSVLARNHRRPIRVWRSLTSEAAERQESAVCPERADSKESTASRERPGRYQVGDPQRAGCGFICSFCACSVTIDVKGDHKPWCPLIANDVHLYRREGEESYA